VQAGLNPDNGDCHGPIWADFDNDGHVDLFIAKGSSKIHPWSVKNYNELWRNNGDGTFTNIAEPAGVIGIGHRGRGAYGVDFNRDGLLDI
jgi:FG-GAP-like repeat